MARFRSVIAGALLVVAAGAAAGFAQQNQKPASKPDAKGPAPKDVDPKMDPKMNPALDAEMKSMVPGPMHTRILKLVGEWDGVTKMEMAGAPASESKGKCTIKPALGGRFLHESGSGDMAGMPVDSFKEWGYNNGSKKFEGAWTWTMSTGMLYLYGTSDDEGKTIDWNAWYDDNNGKRQEFKVQHKFVDDDHYSVKIYGGKAPDGSPGPTLTTMYTRRK